MTHQWTREPHGSWVNQAQNVVEYGLLIAGIVIIVLLGVARFGAVVEPWFASLAGLITTAGT